MTKPHTPDALLDAIVGESDHSVVKVELTDGATDVIPVAMVGVTAPGFEFNTLSPPPCTRP